MVTRQAVEADITMRIATLFERCPALCGFSVQQAGNRDAVTIDLACHPALDREQARALSEAISCTLLELLDELPEAAAMLPGRTFARMLH